MTVMTLAIGAVAAPALADEPIPPFCDPNQPYAGESLGFSEDLRAQFRPQIDPDHGFVVDTANANEPTVVFLTFTGANGGQYYFDVWGLLGALCSRVGVPQVKIAP